MARSKSKAGAGSAALPVLSETVPAGMRRSRRSRVRAAVLIGVHVLIALHVTHFIIAGRTLSPIEPSEAMYTLERGLLNAGFVFFIIALLATLVFGRFVCGWGCHIVALQDLCGWLMKKAGIKPRPFRSRLLLWVPLLLALYMFVWPTFYRWFIDPDPEPFPGFTNHLMTTGFWDTFPGPVVAALTFLTVGFAAVYFLGAKGFCTYGCPYGGFFVVLDRFSPARIVVNDDCEQCGHCTATCTSNVLVHDEVRRFGRVVDPGCMKCMDCVSVCPKNALSYGFARPAAFGPPGLPPTGARRYDVTWPEDAAIALVGFAAFLAFRGLYDGPPLLMSVGLGGISAFLALKLVRLVSAPTVRVQQLLLKLGGEWRPVGRAFAALAVAWFAFVAHSGFVQWQRVAGRAALERTEASRSDILGGVDRSADYSAAHFAAADEAFDRFSSARRWGLIDVAEVELGLSWIRLLRGDGAAAESHLRRAIELQPQREGLRDDLFRLLVLEGRVDEAIDERLATSTVDHPIAPTVRLHLAGLLAERGRSEEAIEQYRIGLEQSEESVEVHYNLGGLLRRAGRNAEAIPHLERALELAPQDPDTHVELGLALAAAGRAREALPLIERAIELAPQRPESRVYLPTLIEQLRAAAAS